MRIFEKDKFLFTYILIGCNPVPDYQIIDRIEQGNWRIWLTDSENIPLWQLYWFKGDADSEFLRISTCDAKSILEASVGTGVMTIYIISFSSIDHTSNFVSMLFFAYFTFQVHFVLSTSFTYSVYRVCTVGSKFKTSLNLIS